MFVAAVLLYLAHHIALGRCECVNSFLQVGRPVQGVKTDTPMTWVEIDALCSSTFLGYKLIQSYGNLTADEKKFCGDELVPFGVYDLYNQVYWAKSFGISMRPVDQAELTNMDRSYHTPSYGNGALNLADGRWHLAEENVTYNCALCQAMRSANIFHYPLYPVAEPLAHWHKRYDVKLVSDKAMLQEALTEEYILRLAEEISKVLNVNETAHFRWSKVDEMKQLELHYHLDVRSLDEGLGHLPMPVFGMFSMTLSDVSKCLEENVVGWDGLEERLPSIALGSIHVTMNHTNGVCTRRECRWNDSTGVDRPTWSSPTYWDIQWSPCSDEEQYHNDNTFGHLLGENAHTKYVHRLQALANSTLHEDGLDEVVKITSRDMMRRNQISQDMTSELATILANVVLDESKDSCMREKNRVHMIVADLMGAEHPVVGFALPLEDKSVVSSKHKVVEGFGNVSPELERQLDDEVYERSLFVAALSEELVAKGRRLAFVIDLKDLSRESKSWSYDSEAIYDIEVTIVLKLKHEDAVLSLDEDNFYVDIMYKTEPSEKLLAMTSSCTAWTAQTNWTSRGCKLINSSEMIERCRCKTKYLTVNDGVLSGLYALKRNFVDARRQSVFTFIADSPVLMASIIINSLFAGVSLVAIVATAAFNNVWIVDWNNKVLLHTIFALTTNMALSMTASFVEFDTECASCAALGVIRHYTFLAMFLWVLVMAGVQVKEIMTKDTEKRASHPAFKVALFAWGVPLAPIGLLLFSSPQIYKLDRFDRGYCYPEKISFDLTILSPVGFSQLVAVCVFVVIGAQVFEFCTKNKKNNVRLSSAERLVRIRTLRRNVVIFLVFTLILLFHYLSEQRDSRDNFLFEFLLLSTMIGFQSIVALFYILLDEQVFAFWRDSFIKLRFEFFCFKESSE